MTGTTAPAMRERSPAEHASPGGRAHGRARPGAPASLPDGGPPVRSLAQREAALKTANDIRTYRARLKRDIKAGRKSLVDLIDDERCQTMKVWDALIALPHYGRTKVNRLLVVNEISTSKTIGGLTHRQQNLLLGALS